MEKLKWHKSDSRVTLASHPKVTWDDSKVARNRLEYRVLSHFFWVGLGQKGFFADFVAGFFLIFHAKSCWIMWNHGRSCKSCPDSAWKCLKVPDFAWFCSLRKAESAWCPEAWEPYICFQLLPMSHFEELIRKSYRYRYRSVINSEVIKVTDAYLYRPLIVLPRNGN